MAKEKSGHEVEMSAKFSTDDYVVQHPVTFTSIDAYAEVHTTLQVCRYTCFTSLYKELNLSIFLLLETVYIELSVVFTRIRVQLGCYITV